MLRRFPNTIRQKSAEWLRQGVSPRRLALTLALGFAIGCFPLFGLTTLLCAAVAMALRLNLPAIQAANYAAMPLQLALIWPFLRLGAKLLPRFATPLTLQGPSKELMTHLGGAAGGALLAWLVCAVPAVLLITFALTPLLRRIPALSHLEAAQ